MDAQFVGRKIAELRKNNNYTQKDIAERLHVSVAAVSKWERGLNYPDMALLEPLAALLGISVPQLLGLDDAPAEAVVKSLVELSQSERRALNRRLQQRILLVLVVMLGFACFVLLFAAGWQQLRDCIARLDGLLTALLPLLLGVAAWALPAVAVLGVRRGWDAKWQRWSLLSLACCAAALYCPIAELDARVQVGDISAVLDTVGGYHFAAIVLLCGTAAANICSYLLNRKR